MERIWWKEGIVYQIYPRSFNDSNGDGIGDIAGIIEKLDYIKSLGVDIIWLCPVYSSPNDDNGYDISDYRQIMTEFGTMADFDLLLSEMKKRELKLVMDLVVNHTSDEHAWFVESRSSKDNPKRDYYIWKKGVNGGPPNNWQSFFGGDAWRYDAQTDEYFLRLFTSKQPDLNWENEEVRKEVYDIMKFWLDKGIDGFRMDVISLISKRGYDDTPYKEFNTTIQKVYANGTRVHEFLQEMNREVISKYDMLTVGEGPGIAVENGLDYVQADRKELNMIFHFDHMFIDHGPGGKFDYRPYDLVTFKKVFSRWEKELAGKGWNSIFLGNHDFPRIVSRFGDDEAYWKESAKALALLLHSLRGTTYIYQGDEIGMTNVAFPSIEDYRDIETHNVYKEVAAENGNLKALMNQIHIQGRDNARTPIQWSTQQYAGFTTGEPWIKLNPNFDQINVASQENDADSILNFYRKVVALRKKHLTLVYGEHTDIALDHKQIFAYWRHDDTNAYLVLFNMSKTDAVLNVGNAFDLTEKLLIICNMDSEPDFTDSEVKLKPWQAALYKIK
ncbi:MAG: alpha-glucosidase [Cyclobacteriaceae bacterium]